MKGIKAAMKPESGQRFGRWTVLDGYITTPQGERKYLCRCDCGTEINVSYNNLMYCGQQSCGCKKKEHDKVLAGYLVHVNGTSIDALESDKIPKNNTTGVKGVYRIKGHYLAKIVFQHRQYSLGTYESLEAAAEARKKAEELLNEKVVGFYEKWSEKAAADPVWAKENPMKIHVSRLDSGELDVALQPTM